MSLTQAELQSALDVFEVTESTCGDLIADSRLYIAPLVPCEKVPTLGILTIDTTPLAAGDATVNLALTGLTSITLEKGFILYFDAANPVEVTTQTVITDAAPVAVPIDSTHTATAAAGTACGHVNRAEALNVASTSLSLNIGTEDTGKTSQGRRTDSVVTTISPEISGELFLNVEDRAVWDAGNIFDSTVSGSELAVFREAADGQFGIVGRVLVTTFDDTSEAQTTVKINYAFKYQSDFRIIKPYAFLSAAERTAYNQIRQAWGLAEVS